MASPAPPRMPFRTRVDVPCALGIVEQSGHQVKTQIVGVDFPGGFRTFGKFALVYVYAGQGIYEDATGLSREIVAGDMILVVPDLPHRYGPEHEGQDWREIYLAFHGPVFDQWLVAEMIRRDLPVVHLEPLVTWCRRMVEVVHAQPPVTLQGALLEVCRMQQLLAKLVASMHPSPADEHIDWLEMARSLLDSGLHPRLAARRMHCSYATFRRRFSHAASCGPGLYQARRAIDRACELMHSRSMSDKQIAVELGFCDEFHFSSRFKQITGLSPRAYRRSLL